MSKKEKKAVDYDRQISIQQENSSKCISFHNRQNLVEKLKRMGGLSNIWDLFVKCSA